MRIKTVCALLSLAFAGACIDEANDTENDPDEATTASELSVDDLNIPESLRLDTSAELTRTPGGVTAHDLPGTVMEAQRYCVDQSFASADRVSCDGQFMTCSNPNWDTSLSRNHPVHIFGCGSGTYVNVHSLWNPGLCYWMRRDAFRPC